MKNKYIIKESYLLIVIIVGILLLCMYSSFALFSLEKTTSKDIVTMKAASNIETTLKIYEYKKVTVPAGSNTSVMVNVNNDTGGSIYYGVFYEMVSPSTKTDDIGIYKIDWSANATSGSITNGSILPVELLVINNSSSDITLNIGVAGSDSNELGLTDGKTLITETFNTGNEPSGDAGETKTTTTDYNFDISKTNGETITLKPGTHKLEAWGASGVYSSANPTSSHPNGYGGYASGTLTLTESLNVTLYIGGSPNSNSDVNYGGWNGGGASYAGSRYNDNGAGGGATDICLTPSSITTDSYQRYVRTSASYLSRILVAGGGGGGRNSNTVSNGGYFNTSGANTYVGSLTAAGSSSGTYQSGGFGYGSSGTSTSDDHAGGGGGWYGGATNGDSYGGGGSSFVWSTDTASSVPSGYTPSTKYQMTNVVYNKGNTTMPSSTSTTGTETGHSGDGHIRITSTIKTSTVPSIDTSAITVSEGDNIDLKSQVTCKDNGAGCKIVLVKPATTKGLTKSTTALYVLEDNNGNRYKYKKPINFKGIASKLIMSQSKGNEWGANAEDGLYATNSYTASDGTTKYHDYRYVGADPDNYVWFNNDMYQIIGVFDENSHGKTGQYLVKLIMANTLGGYSWGIYNSSNTSGTYYNYKNDWTGNTTGIKANLNVLFNEYFAGSTNTSSTYGACSNWTYFYNNTNYRTNDCSDIVGYGIDSSALNSIETTTWYLYGSGSNQSKQNWYLCERGGNSCTGANSGSYSTSTDAKIGLMYLSDYLYASSYYTSSDTATQNTSYFGNKNWLYKGYEWTLTPYASAAYYVWYVASGSADNYYTNNSRSARPSFYLKSTVSISGGDGTFANPYIIE